MKVLDGEGVANHTGPESCAGAGNRAREALTGGHAGEVLSREKGNPAQAGCLERRRTGIMRKATLRKPLTQGLRGLCAVGDPKHAWRHLVRKPGDPTVVYSKLSRTHREPERARR
jgi:hypothetical protein